MNDLGPVPISSGNPDEDEERFPNRGPPAIPRPRRRGAEPADVDLGPFVLRDAVLPVAGEAGGGGFSAQFGLFAHHLEEPLPVSLDAIQAYHRDIRQIVSNKRLTERQRENALQVASNTHGALTAAYDEFVSANIDPRIGQRIHNMGDRMARQLEAEIGVLKRDQRNTEVVPAAVMARPGVEFSQEVIDVFHEAGETLRFYQSLNVVPYSTLSDIEKNRMNVFIMENLIEALRVRLLEQVRLSIARPDGEVNTKFDYFMKVHLRTILKSAPEALSQFFGVDVQNRLMIPPQPEVKLLICNAVIDDVIEKTRGIVDSLMMVVMSSTSQERWRVGAGLLGFLAAESNYTIISSLLSHTKTGLALVLEAAMVSFTNWPAATLSGGAFVAVEYEYIYDLWLMLRLELGMAALPLAQAQHDGMFQELLRNCSREVESGRVAGILGQRPVINGPLDFIGAGKYVLYQSAGVVCSSLVGAANMVRGVSRIPKSFSRFCRGVTDRVGSFLQHQSHQNDDTSEDAVSLMTHECRVIFQGLVQARMLDEPPLSPDALREIERVIGNLDKFDKHVVLTGLRVKQHIASDVLVSGPLPTSSDTVLAESGFTHDTQEAMKDVMDERTNSSHLHLDDAAGNSFTVPNPNVVGQDAPPGAQGRKGWEFAFKQRPFPNNVDAPPFTPTPIGKRRNKPRKPQSSEVGAPDTSSRARDRSRSRKEEVGEGGGGGMPGGGKRVTRRKALTKKNKTKKNKRQSRRKARRSSSCKSRK